jgi:hypothetical protein
VIVRDLSDIGYWTLKVWRDQTEEDMHRQTWWGTPDYERGWFAELNAEIARRCEQMHGQSPPDGFDIHYSPMWLDGCNNHCLYHARRHPWVETAYEKASREGFERWDRREIERTRRRVA